MLEYFSLVLKVKIKVTEAKHRTFRNRLIETLQNENTGFKNLIGTLKVFKSQRYNPSKIIKNFAFFIEIVKDR